MNHNPTLQRYDFPGIDDSRCTAITLNSPSSWEQKKQQLTPQNIKSCKAVPSLKENSLGAIEQSLQALKGRCVRMPLLCLEINTSCTVGRGGREQAGLLTRPEAGEAAREARTLGPSRHQHLRLPLPPTGLNGNTARALEPSWPPLSLVNNIRLCV